MKTIKIIDLLNKISKGEEVPKKIKYCTAIFIFNEDNCNFLYKYQTGKCQLFGCCRLNDEVEIIEEILEEKKLPEKLEEIGKIDYNLGFIDYKNIEVLKTWLNSDIQSILNELDLIVKNQNQLIDYLESKGDE